MSKNQLKIKNIALLCAALIFTFAAGNRVAMAQVEKVKPEPKLTSNKPSIPTEDPESKAWREKMEKMDGVGQLTKISPKVTKAPTTARTRGDQVSNCGSASFKGKCTMYGFVNQDMTNDRYLQDRACGPAALASAIWDTQAMQSAFNYDPMRFAKNVMSKAPPKITLAGWVPISSHVGTDWRQFNYGLDQYAGYGVKYAWIKGLQPILNQVAMGRTVSIMIDLGALPRNKYSMQDGAHWVVIYGYDSKYLYVTNFDGYKLERADLNDAWGMSANPFVGVYAKGHGTAGMGVVVYK
ncbi:hypothetical protein BH10ACI3_BH10ACI3_07090 [soil metagenome]